MIKEIRWESASTFRNLIASLKYGAEYIYGIYMERNEGCGGGGGEAIPNGCSNKFRIILNTYFNNNNPDF